jgi:hypothetical protein
MMMNKTHTMTLSRWHKVAERLSREYTETVYKAKQTLTQTRVSAYVGEGQEQALRDEAADWTVRLERAFRLQDGIATIRRALGDENVRAGVTGQLAEFDKLNRRQKVLTEIVEGQASDMIGIGELKNIPGDYVADGDNYDRRRPQLRVRMLERNEVVRLQQELERVRARAYALADEIAERNKAPLALELTGEVALAAGLV